MPSYHGLMRGPEGNASGAWDSMQSSRCSLTDVHHHSVDASIAGRYGGARSNSLISAHPDSARRPSPQRSHFVGIDGRYTGRGVAPTTPKGVLLHLANDRPTTPGR